ncbi:MAG TPA: hypothetical protein ENN84_03425 [Candidatus Marinimicrobia bacterium]|nr:hypothetical protein [Candidatus Neomarinimicrobiota bacterium]
MREPLLKLISTLAEEMNIFVEALFVNEGARPKIMVLCDTLSGIHSDELTELTLKLRDSAELEAIVGEDFELELSSPGIEFPMRLPRHFQKNIGREIVLTHCRDDLDNPLILSITEVTEDSIIGVSKSKKKEESVKLSYEDIKQGKIKLKW